MTALETATPLKEVEVDMLGRNTDIHSPSFKLLQGAALHFNWLKRVLEPHPIPLSTEVTETVKITRTLPLLTHFIINETENEIQLQHKCTFKICDFRLILGSKSSLRALLTLPVF